MKNINEKKFWITYATLNVAIFLIFIALTPFNYSLLFGFMVGIVSFLLFLGSLKLIEKLIADIAKEKNKTKSKKVIGILIFFVLFILNISLFALFIWLNVYFNDSLGWKQSKAFFPFNVITMTTPYVLLSVYVIIWAIANWINSKIRQRKENNGQITET
ncbi:hypothetical protein [Mycoplasma enhydrae]|uniref:hypothetical protein n=1 Tax=Mycoplasma enhydrae TaxID=2499220 RepID=UPI00197BBE8B|nr:hypothetical protein [Mycoplasma enhydrae]MBN4089254.1 hypothetical protein [Mycoplasma enhydrae]